MFLTLTVGCLEYIDLFQMFYSEVNFQKKFLL